MITLSLIYMIFYVLIFFNLLVMNFVFLPIQFLTEYSLLVYSVLTQKYTNYKVFILGSIISLTGLPPFGLFLIKFNIINFFLYQSNISFIFFIFTLFLLNMFFYAQFFFHKNFKVKIYAILIPKIFKKWNKNINFFRGNTYNHYFFFLNCVNILIILTLNITLFTDYFLIINL